MYRIKVELVESEVDTQGYTRLRTLYDLYEQVVETIDFNQLTALVNNPTPPAQYLIDPVTGHKIEISRN